MKLWFCIALSHLALEQAAAVSSRRRRSRAPSIRATLYLPDAQSGYYRGTRFDWSGVDRQPDVERPRVLRAVVRAATTRSSTTRSPGRSRSSSPTTPGLGYAEAKPGETFVQDRRRRRHASPTSPPTGASPPTRSSIPASGRSTRDGLDRVHPRAARHGGLRLRLPEDAATRQRHAGARTSPEEHRPQARSRPASTTTTSSRSTGSRPARTSSVRFPFEPRAIARAQRPRGGRAARRSCS